MRYRLPLLSLIAVVPLMHVLNLPAAPAPNPSGILQLGGPPPEGWTEDQFLDTQMRFTIDRRILDKVRSDDEVKKLAAVASMEDVRDWLSKNARVTREEGRRLRLTFRAGKRDEQVAIINAFLRAELSVHKEHIKSHEESVHRYENLASKLAEGGQSVDGFQQVIQSFRAEIARLKQTKVNKWAR